MTSARPLETGAKRRKVLVGGGRHTFLNWCRENDVSPHSRDVYFVGHNEEMLLGLELKEDDIVRLGGISHRMEQLLRTRIR